MSPLARTVLFLLGVILSWAIAATIIPGGAL
jgi:hypothetical protein